MNWLNVFTICAFIVFVKANESHLISQLRAHCQRSDFRCDSGTCLANYKVCNSQPDCKDGTDELGCDCLFSNKIPCNDGIKCVTEEAFCAGPIADCDIYRGQIDCGSSKDWRGSPDKNINPNESLSYPYDEPTTYPSTEQTDNNFNTTEPNRYNNNDFKYDSYKNSDSDLSNYDVYEGTNSSSNSTNSNNKYNVTNKVNDFEDSRYASKNNLTNSTSTSRYPYNTTPSFRRYPSRNNYKYSNKNYSNNNYTAVDNNLNSTSTRNYNYSSTQSTNGYYNTERIPNSAVYNGQEENKQKFNADNANIVSLEGKDNTYNLTSSLYRTENDEESSPSPPRLEIYIPVAVGALVLLIAAIVVIVIVVKRKKSATYDCHD